MLARLWQALSYSWVWLRAGSFLITTMKMEPLKINVTYAEFVGLSQRVSCLIPSFILRQAVLLQVTYPSVTVILFTLSRWLLGTQEHQQMAEWRASFLEGSRVDYYCSKCYNFVGWLHRTCGQFHGDSSLPSHKGMYCKGYVKFHAKLSNILNFISSPRAPSVSFVPRFRCSVVILQAAHSAWEGL